MISHFFIDRPIFSAVLSIVIVFAGGVAVTTLPIAQYPDITPPTVTVTCTYPGASASVVADTVAAPIEKEVNGVERMLYMSSQCGNDGAYTLTITFDLGTDLDQANVLVQNRVSTAMAKLPPEVKQTGVTTKKKSPNIMLAINLISDGRYDQLYLSNYATLQVKDEIARISGVGDVTYLGQQDYSMRIWLDPDKLGDRRLTVLDVINALQAKNIQVAAGQLGQPPAPKGQAFQLTLSTQGRLKTPEEFGKIIVKTGTATQGQVTLKQVTKDDAVQPNGTVRAGIELGAQNQDVGCTLNGHESVALAVFQQPGSNALATADAVKAKMKELKARFPQGVDYEIVYDTTPFIHESIHEVEKALRDAIILVAIVVMIFLQSWRSTIIPLIAVPVAIVGTFAALAAFGFSLNNLSLFGLVLAIGIVVDDAIVVVENVERWIHEGLSPRDASRKAMEEVTGPVIAVSLVLCAVFVPCAFISGITGQFFRQFAITIAVSTVISAFNSLTLSPALCRLLLKPKGSKRDPVTWALDMTLGWFFKLFNAGFTFSSNFYATIVKVLLRLSLVALVVYVGLLYMTYKAFTSVPTGFIPNQDKGYGLIAVQLPDAASPERTRKVMSTIERILLGDDNPDFRGEKAGPGEKKYEGIKGVKATLGISGQSILLGSNGSNYGSMYVIFDEFEHRHGAELYADAILARIRKACAAELGQDAVIAAFGAPPVDGLGNAGGFKVMIQDRGDNGPIELEKEAYAFMAAANKDPKLTGVFTQFRARTPQLFVNIDREKCERMGIPLQDVFKTLQSDLGGYYVNDLTVFGRPWQVMIQADARYRLSPEDVERLSVRNKDGKIVPFKAFASVEPTVGPAFVTRYNMYPAAALNGGPAPGVSTGQSITAIEQTAKKSLPPSMSYEWTEITLMQIRAGNTAMLVFAGAVFLVFLVLSAQYESWSLPFSVILVVPMCLLCSVVGVAMAGMDINIFTQIGFVVLVGLASKNAILIVEFAKAERERGVELRTATVEACRLRLRPILMTSLAFILGVVPLVLSSGAGAEMRQTLGLAVFSGMLGVTVFGIFLTPIFYFVIGKLTKPPKVEAAAPATAHGGAGH